MANRNATLSARLAQAIDAGNWRSIRNLIQEGAPPDTPSDDGTTALMAALILDHKDAPKHVKVLLEHGARLDQRTDDGTTPLIAVAGSYLDHAPALVQVLIKSGADVNVAANDGTTPLIAALREGRFAIAKDLLAAGANPNLATASGLTPMVALLKASAENRLDMLQALVARGADVNVADRESGQTPLLVAAESFSDDMSQMVTFLLESGANPNAASSDGTTAIIALAGFDNEVGEALLQACVEHGANVDAIDGAGRSALSRIIEKEHGLSIAKYLLARGASADRADAEGATPLMYAAGGDNLAIVRLLLDHGASVRAADAKGRTSLMYAVDSWRGNPDISQMLIDHGADVNASDADGETVLVLAAKRSENLKLVRHILELGADVSQAARNGQSVLRSAAQCGELKMVRLVFDRGARDPAAVAAAPTEKVAEFLLDNGGDLNATDERGYTLLHRAVMGEWSTRFVERLLKAGADPNVRVGGLTALDAVATGSSAELIRLLIGYGGHESISYVYYVEAARAASAAAASRQIKKLNTAIRKYDSQLRIRGDMTDVVWQDASPDGIMHRAGVMFRAESSLPAMHHVFLAVSRSAGGTMLVFDFVTNLAQRYADGAVDDSADASSGDAFDGRLECFRMRAALETKGMISGAAVDFAAVPVWRIIGDCCLRRQNGLDPVDGIHVSFDGFSLTDDEEDNEDEPTFLVAFDRGDERAPSFYGSLLDCQSLARADWGYIQEKYETDLASQLERSELSQAEFESLARQKYEDSTLIDFDDVLATAARQGDIAAMQQAVEAGADVRDVSVMAAARDQAVIRWLVDAGADVNAASDSGRTALMYKCYFEDTFAGIEALLEFGAPVNAVAADGQTALLAAAGSSASQAKDVVELLLSRGSDARALDQEGNTTVILAAGGRNEHARAIVKALVAAGADPTIPNHEGRTALMAAAGDDSEAASDLLEYLLDCGCDVNASDANGTTALMLAAQCWDDEVLRRVRVLAGRGADGAAKDREGQTAFSLASEDNRALRAFLKKLSAPAKAARKAVRPARGKASAARKSASKKKR